MTDIVNVIKSEDDNFMFQMKSFVPFFEKEDVHQRKLCEAVLGILDQCPG